MLGISRRKIQYRLKEWGMQGHAESSEPAPGPEEETT